MKQHYHVNSGMGGGYILDSYAVETKRDAIRAVAEEARRYRESEWDLPRKDRRVGHGSGVEGRFVFVRPGDVYDLGYYFEWTGPCSETDCQQPGEDWYC